MQNLSPTQQLAYHPDTGRIKLLIWERKLTISRLAAKAGCSVATLSRVINGKIAFNGAWLRWLANELGVPLTSIVKAARRQKMEDLAAIVHDRSGNLSADAKKAAIKKVVNGR